MPVRPAASMLKEAVDDLEWSAVGGAQAARATVHLYMRRDPRRLVFLARSSENQLKVTGEVSSSTYILVYEGSSENPFISPGAPQCDCWVVSTETLQTLPCLSSIEVLD